MADDERPAGQRQLLLQEQIGQKKSGFFKEQIGQKKSGFFDELFPVCYY